MPVLREQVLYETGIEAMKPKPLLLASVVAMALVGAESGMAAERRAQADNTSGNTSGK